jgi:3-methyladenine DNA glycosylase AlkD
MKRHCWTNQPWHLAFLVYLPAIVWASNDSLNFVKKAVNRALRQVGKRNRDLNAAAIATATQLGQVDSRAATWIAADALRELTSEAVQGRVGSRR